MIDINDIIDKVFTNYHGDEFIVLSYSRYDRTKHYHFYNIKFLKTGYECEANRSNIINLNVADKSKPKVKRNNGNIIGKVFTNSRGHTFKVLYIDEYSKYTIKFIESGNIKTGCEKTIIIKGLIRDIVYEHEQLKSKTYTNSKNESYVILDFIKPDNKCGYKCKIQFVDTKNEYIVYASNAIHNKSIDIKGREIKNEKKRSNGYNK